MVGVVTVAVLWGWAYALTKVVLAGASPLFVAWGRVVLGALVLVPALYWRHQRLPEWRSWGHLCVLALTLGIVPFALTAWAQQRVSSALASVLMAAVPIFTAPFAVLLLRERLRSTQLVGLVLGLAGVAVLAGFGSLDVVSSSVVGVGALLGAAANYGFGYTYIKRYLTGLSPLQVAAGSQLTASILLAPLAVGDTTSRGVSFTPFAGLCLVLLGVLSTGAAQLVNYRNIDRLGPTVASLAMYLIPLVGVLAGLVAFGEPLTVRVPLGAAIILLSMAVAQYRSHASQAGQHRVRPQRPGTFGWKVAECSPMRRTAGPRVVRTWSYPRWCPGPDLGTGNRHMPRSPRQALHGCAPTSPQHCWVIRSSHCWGPTRPARSRSSRCTRGSPG